MWYVLTNPIPLPFLTDRTLACSIRSRVSRGTYCIRGFWFLSFCLNICQHYSHLCHRCLSFLPLSLLLLVPNNDKVDQFLPGSVDQIANVVFLIHTAEPGWKVSPPSICYFWRLLLLDWFHSVLCTPLMVLAHASWRFSECSVHVEIRNNLANWSINLANKGTTISCLPTDSLVISRAPHWRRAAVWFGCSLHMTGKYALIAICSNPMSQMQ